MALKRDKYDIEVQNDDEINRNQVFFDFMQRTFNHLDGLCLHEKSLWEIKSQKNQSMKKIEAEFEIPNRKKGNK